MRRLKSTHTVEPWVWDGANRILAGNETLRVAGVALSMPNSDETYANAERIVACVNALAGLNPEGVRELVKAAREAELLLRPLCGCSATARSARDVLREGRAKVEGGSE